MTGERYAYATLERCVAFHHLHNPSARPSAADVATACHVAQRTALLVACAVCDDTDDGGVPLTVVSSPRRRGGSDLDARLVCPACDTVHTITVSLHVDELVDDCGFRMLEPHEVAAAMAFPDGYIPSDLSKKDRVKLAGNAVTPPVMTAIAERIMAALREAA